MFSREVASYLPRFEWPQGDQPDANSTEKECHSPGSGSDKPLTQPRITLAFRMLILFVCLVFLALATKGFLKAVPFGIPAFLQASESLKRDALVKELRRAVVEIRVMLDAPDGYERMGSGFNLEPEGMIITNRHIVEDAAVIRVGFSDGGWYIAHRWYEDPASDLAVIYLRGNNLPAVALSDEPPPDSGDSVLIIGNPLGAKGIAMRGTVLGCFSLDGESVMEVEAAIHSGNSGSPIFDSKGRVVSVVFAVVEEGNARNSRGLAIPISKLRDFLKNLEEASSQIGMRSCHSCVSIGLFPGAKVRTFCPKQ